MATDHSPEEQVDALMATIDDLGTLAADATANEKIREPRGRGQMHEPDDEDGRSNALRSCHTVGRALLPWQGNLPSGRI